MPVEPTQKKLKKRSSRKDLDEHSSLRFDGTHGRELELKRNRGEVSCAECRRLKIKCDKQIPCQSCQRRGCSALCPNGSLATGQGTRFVLAATEHLHRRIARLSGRIRHLEDALSALHAKHSVDGEPHPLLHEDLIRAEVEETMAEGGGSYYADESGEGYYWAPAAGSGSGGGAAVAAGSGGGGVSAQASSSRAEGGGGAVTDLLPAFGTLSISEHGISRFFGPTGGSESLLLVSAWSFLGFDAGLYYFSCCCGQSPPQGPHTPESLPGSKSPQSLGSSSHSPGLSHPSTSNGTTSGATSDPTSTSSNGAGPGGLLSSAVANQLQLFSASFPFTPMGAPSHIISLILSHLPPYDRAFEICEAFFVHAAWIFRGVTRGQLLDEMVPKIYGRLGVSSNGVNEQQPDPDAHMANEDHTAQDEDEDEQEEYGGPHDLALLFIILAVGSLVAPEAGGPEGTDAGVASSQDGKDPLTSTSGSASAARPYFSSSQAEAQALGAHFHQLARAAVALQPVLEKPSLVTIQVLHLMSIYNAMSGSDMHSETSMELTWSLITLAAHLSQTIGLHRDSARWGLSKKMVQRRRILFWDLFVADVWQSLNTGRPPSFSVAYIDCVYPQYSSTDMKSQAGFGSAFEVWQCRFAAECVADVTARTLTAEAPSYATIMELDRKVREFPMPDGIDSAPPDDIAASFQRCVLDHIRETVLMYIHRSFFAQAIIEHPVNPLKSDYAASFIAAYRASSIILKSVRDQFQAFPNTCPRFWTMWTFAFSAAVVFGTVVTRGPRSPLARSAMTELDQACVLFSKASQYSIRASKALVILAKLSEKARFALAAAHQDTSPMTGDRNGLLWNIKHEDNPDDELSIIAGHTRFVSARHRGADGAQSTTVPAPPSSFPVLQAQPPSTRYVETVTIDLRQQQQQRQQSQHNPHAHQISRQPSNISSSSYTSESPLSGSSSGIQSTWGSTATANVVAGPSHETGYMEVIPPPPPPMDYQQYAPSERTQIVSQQQYDSQRVSPPSSSDWSGNQQSARSQAYQPQQGQSYHEPQPQHVALHFHQHNVQPQVVLNYQYQPSHSVQGGLPYEQPVSRHAQHRQQAQARDYGLPQEQHQVPARVPLSGGAVMEQLHSQPHSGSHYTAQYPPRHQQGQIQTAHDLTPLHQQHLHRPHSDQMHPQRQPQHMHHPPQHVQPLHPQQTMENQQHALPPPPAVPHNYSMYNHASMAPPAYQSPAGAPPNVGLAEMGLAARDSRLDERWGSFMADSGLLEDFRAR
ncbi:hypothetical protein D9619_006871 [Psilocybe cf. subviscida]|uniref:Zn(2)-C6 fungal-type domain-containing protein n=1 Tax=Psilocybe cf. subviscida TaxID=2480587 RepID=A0A8H5B4G4_9AGAR|nr:hypothetical protein D9619_006871 [Psilocybe cf. subviscida]